MKVKLTEAPIIQISKAGLSATVDIETQSEGQQSVHVVSTYADPAFNKLCAGIDSASDFICRFTVRAGYKTQPI